MSKRQRCEVKTMTTFNCFDMVKDAANKEPEPIRSFDVIKEISEWILMP